MLGPQTALVLTVGVGCLAVLVLCLAIALRGLRTRLRSCEFRWQCLTDNLRSMVIRIDPEGRITYLNPYYYEVTGFDPAHVLNKHLAGIFHPSDRKMVEQNLERAMAGNAATPVESRVLTRFGPERRILWSSVVIQDTEGNRTGILRIGTDITEMEAAKEARDKALRDLQTLAARFEAENLYLKQELKAEHDAFEIVGQSDPVKYLLHSIRQVAGTEATVLIEGETGVGKELVARAIHKASRRARQPFVRVNCATLPTHLVEAELFGHERGAFTGADRRRKGRFEFADGGTLFLDEVGELPTEIQVKLLRVLQEGEFERVGSSESTRVNVRLIAATNRVLHDEIVAGRFREDLFFRLHVYPITVPPLRERAEDIPLLVQHFVTQLSAKYGKSIDEVPGHILHELTEYDWPGNVRELMNVLERAVIVSQGPALVLPRNLAVRKTPEAPEARPELTRLEDVEREHIVRVLNMTNWRIGGLSGAAELLDVNPSTLRSRMKKLNIMRAGIGSPELPLSRAFR